MNKILPYVPVAILLGTVTMVIPYVLLGLLGSSDYTSLTEGAEPTTGTKQLESEEQAFSEWKDV